MHRELLNHSTKLPASRNMFKTLHSMAFKTEVSPASASY
jgi:hypothetical protein